jgi:DnaJ-class molecular chaperone
MVTRQYLDGCKWCGATGFVKSYFITTTNITERCPVCNGSGVVMVTELIPVNEFSEPDHELLKTST